jgi:hypothetical protein
VTVSAQYLLRRIAGLRFELLTDIDHRVVGSRWVRNDNTFRSPPH